MGVTSFLDLQHFKQKTTEWLQDQLQHNFQLTTVFFSYGSPEARCRVWHSSDTDPQKVLKRLVNFIDKLYEKQRGLPVFLKLDVVTEIEQTTWGDLKKRVHEQPHNNHFRYGIALDEKMSICFLEQEIYGKSIIKGLVYNEPNFFDEKNLQDAIKHKYPHLNHVALDQLQNVWVFKTKAVFFEQNRFIELHHEGPASGIRHIQRSLKEDVKTLVIKNAAFLHDQIQSDGRFIYGYFPAYAREIKSYNTVRHCTAIYALLETLEVDDQVHYLEKIRLSIQYAIDHFYKTIDEKGFMTDGDEGEEIKLGSNAAAIFMFAKYQELTQDDQYQSIAESLARGIGSMVDAQGETTHVLHYPSLAVVEKFRIVYYDGEAALGLLRLYQLNQDPQLLETVKLMFEHFMHKKYDKYHDHWLSYCTNELTKICPEEKYFQFGLNNYLKHLKFIRERKTAYATFVEMMMSAYKMVVRLKQQGFDELYAQSKFEELSDLIRYRVEFQRSTGFFYPEMAMYMAKPAQVLNAFYVRHDRFRVRIDDQEHNLSGYVAFLNHFQDDACISS